MRPSFTSDATQVYTPVFSSVMSLMINSSKRNPSRNLLMMSNCPPSEMVWFPNIHTTAGRGFPFTVQLRVMSSPSVTVRASGCGLVPGILGGSGWRGRDRKRDRERKQNRQRERQTERQREIYENVVCTNDKDSIFDCY